MTPENIAKLASRLADYKHHERSRYTSEIIYWRQQYRQLATDAIDALASAAPQGGVPVAWKLVPVEPTDDMLIEGQDAARCVPHPAAVEDCKQAAACYRAMLLHAPEAQAVAAPGEVDHEHEIAICESLDAAKGLPSHPKDRWLIRYNADGEFGQRTGWLYRDGGDPCIVSGAPVYVWRPLEDLFATQHPFSASQQVAEAPFLSFDGTNSCPPPVAEAPADVLSDVDRSVLREPMDLAFDGPLCRLQFYSRVQMLLDRIEAAHLRAAPVPLTDERIAALQREAAILWGNSVGGPMVHELFARAVERAHGITGEPS